MTLDEEIARKVAAWQRETGTTNGEVCEALGIGKTALCERKGGRVSWRLSEVEGLSKLMGESLDGLMGIRY